MSSFNLMVGIPELIDASLAVAYSRKQGKLCLNLCTLDFSKTIDYLKRRSFAQREVHTFVRL